MRVFDNINLELKDKWLQKLIKDNRHYGGSKLIISSQYIKDVSPGMRGQIKIWCLFPNIRERLLEEIAESTGITAEELLKIYKKATDGDGHDFLYYDTSGKKQFRQNFTHLIT